MAYAYDDDPDYPIPAALMDEPQVWSEEERRIAEAFDFADVACVPLAEAIEMLADADANSPEDEPRWRIADDGEAQWAMAKLAEATATLEALRARSLRWQEKIQAWFEQAAKDPARTAEFFTAHVEWYARQQRAAHDRKSIALPSGRVSTRRTAPHADIANEATLIEWAKIHRPGIVRTREDVLVSTLRDLTELVEVHDSATLVLSDGEVVPWVRDDDHETLPGIGDGWPTPEEASALVGQIRDVVSHHEVRLLGGGPLLTAGPTPVPGTRVNPERITASVKLS